MQQKLETIQPPKEAKDVPKFPDPQTIQERTTYEAALRQARLEDFRQDIRERKKYANRIYWLIVGWLLGIAFLLFCFYSRVDSSVLIALLSGTTVNVLGIFVVVAKYLFPQQKNHMEHLPPLEEEAAN